MAQLTDGKPPKSGTSRFSKALPAVPGLTISSPEPMPTSLPVPPKDLPNPPPPPPPPPHHYADTSSSPSSPSIQNERPLPPPKKSEPSSDRLAAPAPQKMIFPRRPVGADKSSSNSSSNDSKAGKDSAYSPSEPSPALSISSLISAYSRPYESPSTSTGPSQAATPSASSRDTSPSSHSNDESYKPYKPAAEPQVKSQTMASSQPVTKVPAKSELWRRRPQNESKEMPGLELHHSHGSTASTIRPSTAVKSDSSSTTSNSSTPRANRQPPANGGLPGRNVKPNSSGIRLVQSDSQPSLLQNKSSTMSLSNQTVTAPRPGGNGPPTPEYQKNEKQVPVANTIVSPDSPVSSPQSPVKSSSSTAKILPPPPPPTQRNENSTTEIPRRKPAPSPANGQSAAAAAAAANRKVQEVEAVKPFSSDASFTARTAANSDSSRSMPRSDDPSQDSSRTPTHRPPRQRRPTEERSDPSPDSRSPTRRPPPQRRPTEEHSDPSQDSSRSPTRQPPPQRRPIEQQPDPSQDSSRSPTRRPPPHRRPTDERSDPSQDSSRSPTRRPPPHRRPTDEQQSPKRQRPQHDDPRIVHSDEYGPMFRGRYGTLYPEMKSLVEPDARAFRFPTWKGEPIHNDAVIDAHAVKESHHNCFQKHRLMNRRVNRNYPLTCQTCAKADNEDRYACSFCHLRICESCNRIFNNYQRDLSSLMGELARQTPLSLSSSSRPASAFGLQAGA